MAEWTNETTQAVLSMVKVDLGIKAMAYDVRRHAACGNVRRLALEEERHRRRNAKESEMDA